MASPAKTIAWLLMIILLLQGDHVILLGVYADATYRCNSKSYNPDGAYGLHVREVIVDMWITTPSHRDEDYDYYNSSGGFDEPAFGHAKCSTDLSPSDCQSCLHDCISLMYSNCGVSVGARAVLGNCNVRYEAYPITD